jgi:DedD protein
MQKDQVDQVDQGLSFKKRARRRLVGAIALVFLMIIFLPMVLEDREKSIQQEDIEIVMPNEQSSDNDIATAVVGVELDADDEELVASTATTNESSTNNGQDSAKAKSLPAIEAPTKLANVEKIQNTAPPKNTPAGNKYYVQIGVFSDPSNINKLQTKLNDLGYKSLTEKITTDTGVKTRLRTESFTDRNEAAIALENIKDAGLAGMVVNQK